MKKKILLGFSLVMLLPLLVSAQSDSTKTVAFKVKYANTLPKPVLFRGPYLQAATDNSIVIRWRTATMARSRVRFGTEPGKLDRFSDDSSLVTEHKVKLAGLTPYTKYYYSIGSLNDTLQGDNDNYFMTLPEQGKEGVYKIGVFGDCGTNSVLQRDARDAFLKYLGTDYLNAWILLGDNAYENGTDAQYQANFFNVYKNELLKKYPLFPAPGNHDYGNVDFPAAAVPLKNLQVAYHEIFTMPVDGEAGGVASHNTAYYSYDIGNIHFLSLDSYGKEDGFQRMYDTMSPQVQWIKKDLEANTNKVWVIAYWHHPPYTMGSHNSDKEKDLVKIRENLLPILERLGVDLVLCGHSHLYERSLLMKGHFGMENTFNPATYNLSSSSAVYDGSTNSCPYIKDASNNGTVYVVSGSAGKLSPTQASYPHDAMPHSNAEIGGASIIEVKGNRLDFKWICTDGVIRDQFTIMKNVSRKTIVKGKKGTPVTLTASFEGDYQWKGGQKTKSIQVTPPVGKSTFTVKDSRGCITEVFEVQVVK